MRLNTPRGIRTPDKQGRNLLLYPTELSVQTYEYIIPLLYKFFCLLCNRFKQFSQHINLVKNGNIHHDNHATKNINVKSIHFITLPSLGEESNPQQPYYKYGVLPLNYLSKSFPVKIRTSIKGTKNLCPTIERPETIVFIIPQKLSLFHFTKIKPA